MTARWTVRGLLAAAIVVVALLACRREPAVPPPDQVYTVRGEIRSLPQKNRPLSELLIHHEPVPSFTNRDGKVVGMAEMTMPFTPAPGVSLEGFSPGDAVEFVFEVRWNPASSRLTRISKLPADTRLNWGKSPSTGQ